MREGKKKCFSLQKTLNLMQSEHKEVSLDTFLQYEKELMRRDFIALQILYFHLSRLLLRIPPRMIISPLIYETSIPHKVEQNLLILARMENLARAITRTIFI